jgi:PAS domain S-box-containing protein
MHLTVSPMWKPGAKPDKHMEVVLDITRQKMSEAILRESEFRWKFARDGAGDGVWAWTLETGTMLFSHRGKEMLGYGDDDIGDSLEDWKRVVMPEDMTTAMVTLESYMDGVEPPPYHAEYRMLCKDGSWKWALSRGMVVSRADDGRPLRMIGTHTDITQQRQAEADMRQARDAAESANRAKDEFLANITHELRTPLSAVIGFSGLARPLATDSRQRDYLDKVNSAGKTLSGIIDDLLDLSKIAAGRLDLEPLPFTLRQTIERSTSVVSYKVQEKGLQLLERIDQDVPDVLIGDSLRLEQILINLLSNAVKFTAAGRIELRIGLHAREDERVCLNIEVEDTGVGLSEESIAQLFKPFSQADSSMTRKFGGTGLGLAICKHLAEIMDGEIGVTSREDVGSTFRVRLWFGLGVVGATRAIGDCSTAAETTQESGRVRYQNTQVLVVDDQPFNRDIVEGLLAAVGITPQLAENGQQALEILASGEKTFDLVLMDIQMPVMDGLAATRAIRSLDGFADLPVIAMTAHTMAHEKEKGVAAGMSDHIGKPFDEAGFYRVLAKWIPPHKQQLSAVTAPRQAVVHGLPPMCGIDIDAGLSQLLGDEARYRHWLGAFVLEAPAMLQQIRTALIAGQSQPASMLAHSLKGRMGLLGMSALQGIAATLETTIDSAQPAERLLLDMEQGVTAMCAEIRSGLGLAESAGPVIEFAEPVAEYLPPGPPPASVTHLIALLQAGDCDCDRALAACLTELKDTAWTPRLQQTAAHIRRFDFAAAGRLLGAD